MAGLGLVHISAALPGWNLELNPTKDIYHLSTSNPWVCKPWYQLVDLPDRQPNEL